MQEPASAAMKLVLVRDVSSMGLEIVVSMVKEKRERKVSSVAHTSARTKTAILLTILVSFRLFAKNTRLKMSQVIGLLVPSHPRHRPQLLPFMPSPNMHLRRGTTRSIIHPRHPVHLCLLTMGSPVLMVRPLIQMVSP